MDSLQKSNLLFFCLPSRLTNREESSNRWLSQRPIWLLNVEVKRQTRCRCYIKRLELKFGRTRGPRDSSHYKWHQMEKEDFFVSSCQMELVHAMPTKFQVLIRLLFCKFLVWHPADNICGKLLSLTHTQDHIPARCCGLIKQIYLIVL